MEEKGHVIRAVNPGSIAQEMGIEQGDRLLAIDGQEIRDIFDYQYYIQDEYIEVLVEKHSGEEWLLEIDKEYEEDLGVEFENGLMDDYRSCHNRCIFCFIDQMPKGMRDTLYFKDDDSRLSFLQGNYVTLTNTSEEDIDRIIRYHLSPINISFQTTDPELRCKMLHNRFAGEALKKVDRLYAGGIRMNGQIVLCKGVNDKGELNRSIRDLTKYIPQLESVSVVPVGLSKYREGLYPLEPFTKEDAREVIAMIHGWQEEIYALHGIHFIHASDEWYILAELPLPEASRYDGYLQLENGVGMVRLLKEEVKEMLTELQRSGFRLQKKREVSLATGLLPFRYIQEMAEELMRMQSHLTVRVYPIRNDFFGELITVSGLLTGGDIQTQLMGKELGEELLLPQNVLRSGEDVFLDDMTVSELGNTLQVNINIVKSSGRDFVKKILGIV